MWLEPLRIHFVTDNGDIWARLCVGHKILLFRKKNTPPDSLGKVYRFSVCAALNLSPSCLSENYDWLTHKRQKMRQVWLAFASNNKLKRRFKLLEATKTYCEMFSGEWCFQRICFQFVPRIYKFELKQTGNRSFWRKKKPKQREKFQDVCEAKRALSEIVEQISGALKWNLRPTWHLIALQPTSYFRLVAITLEHSKTYIRGEASTAARKSKILWHFLRGMELIKFLFGKFFAFRFTTTSSLLPLPHIIAMELLTRRTFFEKQKRELSFVAFYVVFQIECDKNSGVCKLISDELWSLSTSYK